MTTPPPPQPTLRSIVVGILLGVVLVVVICSASSVVKWVGAPFLVVPRVLGILEPVRGNEIVTVPMGSPPTAVTFPRPDTYAIYIADVPLLETTNTMIDVDAAPWLVIQRADTGETIPVEYIDRGLIPFDEPRVPGRPVMRIEVPAAGTYVMVHPRRGFSFYLVPDRVSGKEALIVLLILAQLALLSIPLLVIYGRPWLARRRRWREHQRERREASDAVLRRRANR
ncbi:MAG TPA: hypothetical protein VLL77_10530 [Anaerolineales bacterium]|nr:hypothetical protein [Anaerolineales bacterium]